MKNSVLEISNLNFSYGRDKEKEKILIDVSFYVPKGGVTTIMGRNGSGKTTLLKCINNVYNSYTGSVYLEGVNIKSFSRREISKKITLVTPSQRNTFSYSIIDYVMMGRSPHQDFLNTPREVDYEKAKYFLELFKISDYKNKNIKETSSGEFQMINLAKAMSQDTEIILLDEPSSYLDYKNQILIFDVIRRLSTEFKKAVIMTLHNPNEVLNHSDNVVILDNGRVLDYGKIDIIFDGKLLSDIFNLNINIKKIKNDYFVQHSKK